MKDDIPNRIKQIVDYQSLIYKLQEFQDDKRKLDGFIDLTNKSFSELKLFLQNWELRYDFDTITEDINGILGDPVALNNVMQLQERLNDIKSEVEKLEDSLKELEKVCCELNQKPDRYGKVEVILKVELFLKSLCDLHIAQVRPTLDEIIPGLIREMQVVLKAFGLENDKQVANRELATKLLERMDGYHDYADKFNVFRICESCRSRVTAVMQNPDVIPEKDTANLVEVQNELDALDGSFAEEQRQFDELAAEINDNMEKIWEEDYEAFTQVLDEKSCKVTTTIEELRYLYETDKQRKRDDIVNVEAPYNGKLYTWKTFPVRCSMILAHFRGKLNELRNTFTSKSNLNGLIYNVDEYIRSRKREIWRNIWEGLKKYVFKPIYWVVAGVVLLIVGIIKFFASKSDD